MFNQSKALLSYNIMTVGKYIIRLKKLNTLLEKQKTGNSIQMAQKLGISQRQLQLDLKDLNKQGIKITFDKAKASYYYSNGISIKNLFEIDLN